MTEEEKWRRKQANDRELGIPDSRLEKVHLPLKKGKLYFIGYAVCLRELNF